MVVKTKIHARSKSSNEPLAGLPSPWFINNMFLLMATGAFKNELIKAFKVVMNHALAYGTRGTPMNTKNIRPTGNRTP